MGMSAPGGNGGGPSTLAEINVTPLVDVMLVLLIIFMVTASVETVRAERELQQSQRVERDLVPRKPEPPKNPLKDVPITVPNTNVQEVKESEQREPKVVLDRELVFRLDATAIVDCKTVEPALATADRRAEREDLAAAFERCATKAASVVGPNALIQEKKRVNFAADRTIPWGWATKFMAIMGTTHGIKQVNIVTTGPATMPEAAK